MDFIQMLKAKQRELNMTKSQFAKYIYKHRTWVFDKFGPEPYKHPLSESTMYTLHTLLDIPYETMDEFNTKCKENN